MKNIVIALVMVLACTQAYADEVLSESAPFAEHHLIMQVSQNEEVRKGLTLDVANNLGEHYGSHDIVDIEIIAFGPGVALVLAEDNPHRQRIESLMAQGVRFYVCGNTLDTLERKHGRKPSVLQGVTRVQAGVAFMLEEIGRGYVHIKP